MDKTKKIKLILKYAEEQYKITFPKYFMDEIVCNLNDGRIPKKEIIDSVINEWKFWEKYVEADSFNDFVVEEIRTIFRINTVSTFGSRNLKGFIGNKAKVKGIAIPPTLASTIRFNGELLVDA